MNNARRALALPFAFAIAAAIVLVGHDAFGTRPASAPATKVATVNMTTVFERINANTPWEKLKIPDALNINTKPSATSEYITPDMRPPITTSKKKTGSSAISRNGAAKTACNTSIINLPESICRPTLWHYLLMFRGMHRSPPGYS